MPEGRRIRIPNIKGDVLSQLVASRASASGIFDTQADALAFAAAVGAHHDRFIEQNDMEFAGEPIRYEVFKSHGYELLFDVLVVGRCGSAGTLARTEDVVDQKAGVFEGYAAGGLVLLTERLKGQVDVRGPILLMLKDIVANHPFLEAAASA